MERNNIMDGLFINYRREDSAPYAGRLYDFLRRTFPNKQVFMDIDTIDPGEDFVDAISKTLESSKVVIAVIGPKWIESRDGTGSRRLDNPDDYVVRELSAALVSGARVIPVLVGGASMPRTESLPVSLQLLARRNAIEISDTRFTTDSERLGESIARLIEPSNIPGERPPKPGRRIPSLEAASDSLTTFKTLLWTGFALEVTSGFIQISKAPEGQAIGVVIVGTLVLALTAWFNIMLARGRNWARMAYIALAAFSFPAIFVEFSSQSGAEIALNLSGKALTLWLLRMMFTEPIRQIFVRR